MLKNDVKKHKPEIHPKKGPVANSERTVHCPPSFLLPGLVEQNSLSTAPHVDVASTRTPYAAFVNSGTHERGFCGFTDMTSTKIT